MATPISCGFPWLCDGATVNGQLGRTVDTAALTLSTGSASAVSARGGVLPAAGAEPLQVSAATGMQITINPGFCIVPNATSSLYGAYRMALLSQGTITLDTSDAVNPRIDLVVAQVVDNGDATSVAQIAVLTGTAAPVPAAPSITGLHVVVLAQIAVAANVTSIVAANITDKRQFTTVPGGRLDVNSQAERDAIVNPPDGMKIFRRDTGNEEIYKKSSSSWLIIGTVTDSGWITWPTSGTNVQLNAGSPAYRKVQAGPQPRVYFRGSLKPNTNLAIVMDLTVSGGMLFGTLPAGYRPASDVYVTAATSLTSQPAARLRIGSNGQVRGEGPQGNLAWCSLDGVSYEQGA
ncbi:hypothetical protein [Actinoallomurus sp. NPDC052274]|uniref:hypothetical protein n=1 Tax=Actinoallomurus sp. NPDC052274 TaxID=3155420 RepID=UPI003444FB6B